MKEKLTRSTVNSVNEDANLNLFGLLKESPWKAQQSKERANTQSQLHQADMNNILLTVFNLDVEIDSNQQGSRSKDEDKKVHKPSINQHEKSISAVDRKGTIDSFSDIKKSINDYGNSMEEVGYSKSKNDLSLHTENDYALNQHHNHERDAFFINIVEPKKQRDDRRYTMFDVSSSNKSQSKSQTLSKLQSSSVQSLRYSSSSGMIFIKSDDFSAN